MDFWVGISRLIAVRVCFVGNQVRRLDSGNSCPQEFWAMPLQVAHDELQWVHTA